MTSIDSRKLVLLRHAKSAWPDVPDDERPLARRGRRDAPVMGRWLRVNRLVPDQVLCSTARRARQTWQLARDGLEATPPVTFERRVYQASAEQLLDLVRAVPPAVKTLLIVGHDPAIQELALMLAQTTPSAGGHGGSGAVPDAGIDQMRVKFPTAAVAVLEFTGSWDRLGPGTAQLTAFAIPREVGSAGGG
jgi:phosphohistidine phosphatase